MLSKEFLKNINKYISWRKIWIVLLISLVFFGIIFTSLLAYGASYDDRVLPGLHVDDIDIGGMDEQELRGFLQDMNTKLVDEGIRFVLSTTDGEEMFILDPTIVTGDNFIELISMDIDKEVVGLLNYQKTQSSLGRALAAIVSRITTPHVKLQAINVDRDRLSEEIKNRINPYGTEAKNAGVIINSLSPIDYTFVSSTRGVFFQYDEALDQIISDWSVLRVPEVRIESKESEPDFYDEDLQKIIGRLPDVFGHGGLDLRYTDSHTKITNNWHISEQQIANWIDVQQTNAGLAFGLNVASTTEYIENNVVPKVNKDAQDAKFKIEGNNYKVTEFAGSRPGVSLDTEATYQSMNEAIIQRTWHDEGLVVSIPLVVDQVEPNIKTGEVNDLGIKEILGIGYSNFSGSPANRIKNIRHAVKDKLEGLLIPPDQEFSLLHALEPFTIEGGYLPELVIKGDEIKPEIAGGLCQVGSTMFRTVMNSGLPVTARRNHSLVVSYYNDHRNGLPGTDATIYDPAPDFRFLNDTGHYILITTEMNANNGDLYFTMWGTSNGRVGKYTEPVVQRWIPAGETKNIETTNLEPGEQKCQSAHPGAETYFTYIQNFANGEKKETVYSSYYRPLPKICLVGVEKIIEEEEECQADDLACIADKANATSAEDAVSGDILPAEIVEG